MKETKHTMISPDVQKRVFARLIASLATMVILAAPFQINLAAASAPNLGTAASFGVLGGPAVTLTSSTVFGDVGTGFPGAPVTNTLSSITGTVHAGDAVSIQAYSDFLLTHASLASTPCGTILTGTLANQTLAPGVYCFPAAATLTGVLTLDAQGDPNAIWIFKIGSSGTGALTGTGFSVVMAGGGSPCNVYWDVAQAATMTTSNFQGTILAGAAITVTGGTFNGSVFATDAVTLTGANIAGCGSPTVTPVTLGSIKVTGGGQIPVPSPDSIDPTASGIGRATFGFNARPSGSGNGAKGNFNYVNHVTGLHIDGSVDNIVVIATNPDGSPKTVLFSGTYAGGDFIVTVEDHGEPGTNDQLGILVFGSSSEERSMRVISNGDIQFHK